MTIENLVIPHEGHAIMMKLVFRSMLAAAVTTASLAAAPQAEAEPATAAGLAPFTAAALQAVQDCPSEYACLWTAAGWEGDMWKGKNRNNRLPGFIDQKSKSSANHGIHYVACFWTEQSGRGQVLAEGIGSIRQNLAYDSRPGGGNWANVIRSLTWRYC